MLLEGEKSASFSVEQGVAQGCSLSAIFINDLLKVVEKANLWKQSSSGKTVGGLLFADDFVGFCNSAESLKSLINPRRACAGGLRYLSCLFVCLSVCLSVTT